MDTCPVYGSISESLSICLCIDDMTTNGPSEREETVIEDLEVLILPRPVEGLPKETRL